MKSILTNVHGYLRSVHHRPVIATFVCLLILASSAVAIHPGRWTQTTEADFDPGKKQQTVATNHGEIKLAASTRVLSSVPDKTDVIYDLQMIKDRVYMAAGPESKLMMYQQGRRPRGKKPANAKPADKAPPKAAPKEKKGAPKAQPKPDAKQPAKAAPKAAEKQPAKGKAKAAAKPKAPNVMKVVLELKDEQIFALDTTSDGKLLVGVSGAKNSRLAVLDANSKLKTVVELKDVRYIWDMLVVGKKVYLATGTKGKLLLVDFQPAKPAVTELLDAAQANLLCLGRDGRGRVYAGTDTDGLVYRVGPKPNPDQKKVRYESFVLYDANEAEIGALVVLPNGTVYAGTAAANQARPGRMSGASRTQTGRPSPSSADKKSGAAADKAQPKSDKPKGDNKGQPKAQPKPDAKAPAQPPKAQPAQPQVAKPDVPEQPAEPKQVAPPTQQQRDRLRQEIRKRLQAARRSGTVEPGQMQTGSVSSSRSSSSSSSTPRPTGSTRSGAKRGNAVYRIDPHGFVTEVFRESVMILNLALDGDTLLVATGNEGQLYRVDPAKEETVILADFDAKQLPKLLRNKNGVVTIGTANPAQLIRLQKGFARKGQFTSEPLDAKQISLWGTLKVTGRVEPGTTIAIQTRSGNVSDPDKGGWSSWSKAESISHQKDRLAWSPVQIKVTSAPARFLQYRATLSSNGKQTSVLEQIQIAYVLPNIKPAIASVQATYGTARSGSSTTRTSSSSNRSSSSAGTAAPTAQTALNIKWTATDPNEDQMHYKLQYRASNSQTWIELAKDQKTNRFAWDTRRVPDGRYVVRVIASDSPDNPPDMAKTASRDSEPVLVDNTPPQIADLKGVGRGADVVIGTTVRDALSDIVAVHYAVDSTEKWQAALPADLIFDSTSEKISITLSDLSPGAHVVTLRVSDEQGNTRYQALPFEVKKKVAAGE